MKLGKKKFKRTIFLERSPILNLLEILDFSINRCSKYTLKEKNRLDRSVKRFSYYYQPIYFVFFYFELAVAKSGTLKTMRILCFLKSNEQ